MNKENSSQKYVTLPRPWAVALGEDMYVGAIVKGRVTIIRDFGVVIEIMPGIEGLLRVPEVTWANTPINIRDHFKLGQEVQAKIKWLDRDEKRMYLSIKQMTEDPWNKIIEKYPLWSCHIGLVKKITPYGIFVELDYGIMGMILLNDIPLEKRNILPSELIQKGQNIEVVILNIDIPNRKLFLGYK